ncbi:hypothetical protein GTPT_2621 [Tatumella ptyseos ATCC 33301]|uniref:Uncharacterized protein n=1 Tax=Tatumella ptyseos ATCC 33301 TaxID=1005995 RepID=A0A085JD85_9GAMM|nr:hypothetical protein GTPT_2621 [Tatumella ptyseos ATCC 33301]
MSPVRQNCLLFIGLLASGYARVLQASLKDTLLLKRIKKPDGDTRHGA